MASSASGQDDPNRALWLATRAGKMEPSCPLGTTRCNPQARFPRKPYNKYFNDQVCSVKMAGYWPRFLFASLWTETNLANIQLSWPHTWSITHIYFLLSEAENVLKTFLNLRGILCITWWLWWCGNYFWTDMTIITADYYKPRCLLCNKKTMVNVRQNMSLSNWVNKNLLLPYFCA